MREDPNKRRSNGNLGELTYTKPTANTARLATAAIASPKEIGSTD